SRASPENLTSLAAMWLYSCLNEKGRLPRVPNRQCRAFLSLSPCGRGWTRCEASRTGEGSVSADRDPSSGADYVRATFSHKGRRERNLHRPLKFATRRSAVALTPSLKSSVTR